MFKIFGEHYYVDMDAVDEFTRIDGEDKPTENDEVDNQTKVHIVKYEMIKYMLEILMDPQDEIDEKMALSSNETSVPFRLAFNTLLMKKIINKL